MNPGRLDSRILLQSPTSATSGSGAVSESWISRGYVWAAYMPQTGAERFQSMQETGLTLATFRIRWRSGVDETWRVQHDGRTWELIAPPVEQGRRSYLDLICQSTAPVPATPDEGLIAFSSGFSTGFY